MKISKVFLVFILLFILTASSACASDVDFGSTARLAALGGAGLALADGSGSSMQLNPASPAAAGVKFKFMWPGLSFHADGASMSDLTDSLNKISNSDSEGAIQLANDFAGRVTTFNFSSIAGFVGTFGAAFEGEARGIINPGKDASEWVNAAQSFDSSSFNLTNIQSNITNSSFQSAISSAQAGDMAAANNSLELYLEDLSQNYVAADVVYGPSISFSHSIPNKSGQLWVGTTMKFLHSKANRWQIEARAAGENPVTVGENDNVSANVVFDAVELPAVKSNGLKTDVGLIFKPKNSKVQYGMVINNFIEPGLKGITNAQNDRMISVGMAANPVKGLVVAADLVNLTGANDDDMALRFGGEWQLGKLLTARAGYSGRYWTYGFNVLGMDVAFSGKAAQLLTNVFKF